MASIFPGLTLSPGDCSANRGTLALVVIWTLLSIGIIVVSLRLNVRFRIRHNAGWDDYMTIAALVRVYLQNKALLYYYTKPDLIVSLRASLVALSLRKWSSREWEGMSFVYP